MTRDTLLTIVDRINEHIEVIDRDTKHVHPYFFIHNVFIYLRY